MSKKFLIQQIRFKGGVFAGINNLGVHNFGQAIQLLRDVFGAEQAILFLYDDFNNPFGVCSGSQVSFYKDEDTFLITTVY